MSRWVLFALAVVFLIAAQADPEPATLTLTDCTAESTDGGVRETCTVDGEPPEVMGTWVWVYEIEVEDEPAMEVHRDDVVIDGGEGGWEGEAERQLAKGDQGIPGAQLADSVWSMSTELVGTGANAGLAVEVHGEGNTQGPPYPMVGEIGSEESFAADDGTSDDNDRPILTAVILLVLLAIPATPAVIAALKGRWWMGAVGLVAVVAWFALAFGLFGIDEPSEEFQETATFTVVNAALKFLMPLGFFFLLFGSIRRARSGSWWDRRRSAEVTQ